LFVIGPACEKIAAAANRQDRGAILSLGSFADAAAQPVSHELLPVANAEHRGTASENSGIHLGALGIVDAGRPAGNDDAATTGEVGGRSIAGADLGINTEITYLAGDQMAVLAARVENRYLGVCLSIQLLRHSLNNQFFR
jgi:hypothetical protein